VRLFALLLVLSMPVYAHQDTVIKIDGNKLVGLPDNYLPAIFDFSTNTLSVKDILVTFPKCLTNHYKFDREIDISASWYHSFEYTKLPPYIRFRVEGSEFGLILDLDTLKPISTSWTFGKTKTELDCIKQFKVVQKKTYQGIQAGQKTVGYAPASLIFTNYF